MGPEHGGERPPLDPPGGRGERGMAVFEGREDQRYKPGVELWWRGSKMTTQVMAPVAKPNIRSPQSEVDLEVQRRPTLMRLQTQCHVHVDVGGVHLTGYTSPEKPAW